MANPALWPAEKWARVVSGFDLVQKALPQPRPDTMRPMAVRTPRQRRRCMMRRSTYPSSRWRNPSGTVPITAKPSRRHSAKARAFIWRLAMEGAEVSRRAELVRRGV